MDPIKVDFSKKDGGRKKDVVIPPEKAALKIVLSLLCSAVFAGILFYFMLPALNFKSYDLYIYLGAVVASYVVFNALFSNVFGKPEYVPYVKRRAIVPGIIIAVLLVAVGIGYLVSCEFFRASSYSKIISIDTDSNFSEDVEEQTADSFSEIPKLDGLAVHHCPREFPDKLSGQALQGRASPVRRYNQVAGKYPRGLPRLRHGQYG